MGWDRNEGQRQQRQEKAMQHRGKKMNEELAGPYELRGSRLQKRHEIVQKQDRAQVDEFKRALQQQKDG